MSLDTRWRKLFRDITGYRGRGKSYFAAQMENPTLTLGSGMN